MEARDDFLGQLDLDVTRIGALLNVRLEPIDLVHAAEAEQFEVAPHQRIGDGYQLAVHHPGRFLDTDIVPERLGHLLDAIEPLQKRHGHHALRGLTIGTLQFPPHQQIELLIRTTQFYISLEGDRVVALHQRIEKLVNRDRLIG